MSAKATKRLAEIAINNGLDQKNIDGKLLDFINATYREYKTPHIKLYGEFLFCFGKEYELITLYRIPKKFLKIKRRKYE